MADEQKTTNPWMYPEYFGYLLKHKYNTYKAGRELGLDRIQLLAHDLSKFGPAEFGPYARFFYGNPGIPKVRTPEFTKAVKHHRAANAHHYFSGVPILVEHPELAPEMVPLSYRLERLADWYGVGRSRGTIKAPDFKTWWANYKNPVVDQEVIDAADIALGLPLGTHMTKAAQAMSKIALHAETLIKARNAALAEAKTLNSRLTEFNTMLSPAEKEPYLDIMSNMKKQMTKRLNQKASFEEGLRGRHTGIAPIVRN